MPDVPERQARALMDLARRRLAEAERLVAADFPAQAVREAYYAMYHAAHAALVVHGSVPRTHRGTLAEFNRLLVQKEAFPRDLAGAFGKLLGERLRIDYEGVLLESTQEAEWAVKRASAFLDAVEAGLPRGQ